MEKEIAELLEILKNIFDKKQNKGYPGKWGWLLITSKFSLDKANLKLSISSM